MGRLVGELDDLVLNRRTVARPNRLDLPTVHGRAMDVLANDFVRLGRGECDVAGHLLIVMRHPPGTKAERRRVVIARLHRELRPVDAASVKPRRRARLQAATAQAQCLQRLAQQHGGGLATAPRGILLLAAMNQPIKKCSGGDDDRLRSDRAAIAEANAVNDTLFALRFTLFARVVVLGAIPLRFVILSGAKRSRRTPIAGRISGVVIPSGAQRSRGICGPPGEGHPLSVVILSGAIHRRWERSRRTPIAGNSLHCQVSSFIREHRLRQFFDNDLHHFRLLDMQIRLRLQHLAHLQPVLLLVALRSGRPHGRPA